MPNDRIEYRFRDLWRAIAELRRIIRTLASGIPPGAPTIDEFPDVTPTVDPQVYEMPFAYPENGIDAMVGPKRLVPGTDFTTSGLDFTFGVDWPDGTDGQDFVVFRARRP